MKNSFHALILAAGKSTRFHSATNKVLHPLLGKPMLGWVVDCLAALKPEAIHIVIGYQKQKIMSAFPKGIQFVVQSRQLGTAHAVQSAKKVLRDHPDRDLLVINADLPLIRPQTLRPFLRYHRAQGNTLTFLTADLENPAGFGRVIHLEDKITRIVEEKDATPAQRSIKESNLGIYLFRIRDLFQNLDGISNRNKKGEYYLTDIIEIMTRRGKKVSAFKTGLMEEFIGVNDRYELAGAAQTLRLRKIKKLAESGVTIYDPASTWIDETVRIGKDTVLYPSVCLEGSTKIGEGCTVHPFVHLVDVEAGDGVRILSSTMAESTKIEDGAQVGPFSRIRPKTLIRQGARVGNFVEMKSTRFGRGSKAGHLSYIGDAEIGDKVNIGAGTITCNYDGVHKHKTVIEEGAFIGSGTELVAPVKIGRKAYVGAGSTITKDVAPGSLAVARGRQMEKRGWAWRKKKK